MDELSSGGIFKVDELLSVWYFQRWTSSHRVVFLKVYEPSKEVGGGGGGGGPFKGVDLI